MTVVAPETPALRTARLRAIGALILIVFAGALAFGLPQLLPLQDAFFDAMQRRSPRAAESTPVTIVQIDEKSISTLGHWPWPRTLLAQLVHTINAYGPAAIGIDIVMSEPDPFSPERALAHVDADLALLERIASLPSNDAELATAFRVAPVVVVLAGAPGSSSQPIRVPPILVRDARGQPDDAQAALTHLMSFPGALSTLATLNDAASGWGLIDAEDAQGIIRRVPLIANVNGTPAPSFALEMWRVALRAPALRVATANGAVESVMVGDRTFVAEPDGNVRLYFSRRNRGRAVSAVDVLNGSVAPDQLKRSFVLVGVTALALGDNVWTPIAERMPGVELHAQLIENMNDPPFLTRPPWAAFVEAGVLLVLGTLLIISAPRWPVRYASLVAVACALVLLPLAYFAFRMHRLLFDAATPAVALLTLFAAMLALTLADATRNRKALQEVVQRQREESARVAGEMQAAQRIQLDTLPAADSLHDPRVELAAFMEPALEVGGDLYDFYKLDDRRLFFMLGDVSGKGLPASIFMAVSKALCKSTMLRSGDADLGTLMMRMNEEVSRDNPAALFVTVFAGLLDLDSGELHYCNAGQDNPWLKSARDGTVTRLSQGGGPPLCVVEDFEYGVSRRALGREDIICIVSDGITEAQDGRNALYGAARVESLLSSGCKSSREMLEMIRADVRKFVGDNPQADDMTVLTVRWV
ncbi:MAG TPA: CHASE2 domain-containing protein [Casimicrobiaceae bacterium]|nr:CHASE2 domain-containing protein [Casimicrobiaceae bacterium]